MNSKLRLLFIIIQCSIDLLHIARFLTVEVRLFSDADFCITFEMSDAVAALCIGCPTLLALAAFAFSIAF